MSAATPRELRARVEGLNEALRALGPHVARIWSYEVASQRLTLLAGSPKGEPEGGVAPGAHPRPNVVVRLSGCERVCAPTHWEAQALRASVAAEPSGRAHHWQFVLEDEGAEVRIVSRNLEWDVNRDLFEPD